MRLGELITQLKYEGEYLRKFITTIFVPTYILYSYYVFIGFFYVNFSEAHCNLSIIALIIYQFIISMVVVHYMLLIPKPGVSTRNLSTLPLEKSPNDFSCLNMYLSEYLKVKHVQSQILCITCGIYKPPRAHHCTKCNSCYLRMDHHCVWINNCVAFHNYKFFILFMFWLIFYAIFVSFNFFYSLIGSDTVETGMQKASYIICIAFSIVVLLAIVPLLFFHLVLLFRNETTIENIAINEYIYYNRKNLHAFQEGRYNEENALKDRQFLNPYNLGWKENFKQIFGKKWYLWFLPVETTQGDGYDFEKNITVEDDLMLL
ncbi:hypothetical protein EDEG_01277 [Edhazardia aedis USNM 41457]|uniref:Palmitoyltransferase n=1 Tax=Edhazardia aedis (strain USNM 41457) TaxID=1003232 RepID=J9DAH5_EDHAE|nr:hypothetical protein EDEG_01277 [Edhazardia aedis USNM 41457]|eukprot:EJW04509.1 hypothetical protein EDEG_01277 [Edhazardia aedis USNM 41457]